MSSSKKVLQKNAKKRTSFQRIFRRRTARQLEHYLGFTQSQSLFLSYIACGLIKGNAIWLKRICQASSHRDRCVQVESDIRRLERFLQSEFIDYTQLSRMIWDTLYIKTKVTLAIDRTNWKYGNKNINILVVTVLYTTPEGRQFAIPIAWEVFDKQGNSNTQERTNIMIEVLRVIGAENIECILGDREFIGEEWMRFLLSKGIPFGIRIRSDMYVLVDGKEVHAGTLAAGLKEHDKIIVNVVLDGIPLTLAATKTKDGEDVIVVASPNISGDPLSTYRLRWLIELFFKSIKSKGFQIEDTHITDPFRVKKLFALVAIAALYAVRAGIVRHAHVKKVPVKCHKRATYSLFTYGLDFLRTLFEDRISIPKCLMNLLTNPTEIYSKDDPYDPLPQEILSNLALLKP